MLQMIEKWGAVDSPLAISTIYKQRSFLLINNTGECGGIPTVPARIPPSPPPTAPEPSSLAGSPGSVCQATLTSDRGAQFTSALWAALCSLPHPHNCLPPAVDRVDGEVPQAVEGRPEVQGRRRRLAQSPPPPMGDVGCPSRVAVALFLEDLQITMAGRHKVFIYK
jgi:hypothetical protein